MERLERVGAGRAVTRVNNRCLCRLVLSDEVNYSVQFVCCVTIFLGSSQQESKLRCDLVSRLEVSMVLGHSVWSISYGLWD